MLSKLFNRIHEAERRFMRSFGTDISTPRGRRQAKWHFYMFDHGILRGLWTNMYQIAPGVWRSNQPSFARLKKLKEQGIRTVLNLRGEDKFSFYLFEKEACEALGLEMIDIRMRARSLVPQERFMELFEIFDRIEKPFVLHCKSGADRAGLVSALWLLDKEGASIAEAKKMLSLKYAHLKRTKTGLMDYLLERYETDNAETPMSIRQWFAERYDAKTLFEDFQVQSGRASAEAA
ncbi:tyrosine-protein phosphatase [Pseudoruegeria sp. HB172150]|uniref:fused DSP-PTPase phosphatase/NAD kinase-like protein n=1 Tax=Pseudoruegeria sp. HB172150 TaxID=2721164 RepID=UPI0020A67DC0|nr:tyrosine-protein phosphatase [Pseudoruegeria sp. HB172150]